MTKESELKKEMELSETLTKKKELTPKEKKKLERKVEDYMLKYGIPVLCAVCGNPFGRGFGSLRKVHDNSGKNLYVHEYCMEKFTGEITWQIRDAK